MVARLSRQGVNVGGTATSSYRIEVHSITEGEALEKDGKIRSISMSIECMTTTSLSECARLNAENLSLLETPLTLSDGFACLGIIPKQLRDLIEESDTNKLIYRLIQQIDVFVQDNGPQGSGSAGGYDIGA